MTHAATAGRLIEALLGLGPEHRRLVGPLANCAWSELSALGAPVAAGAAQRRRRRRGCEGRHGRPAGGEEALRCVRTTPRAAG